MQKRASEIISIAIESGKDVKAMLDFEWLKYRNVGTRTLDEIHTIVAGMKLGRPREERSLRDWFAGKSVDAAYNMEKCNPTYDCDGCASFRGVAERAYLLADAMLKAREVEQ